MPGAWFEAGALHMDTVHALWKQQQQIDRHTHHHIHTTTFVIGLEQQGLSRPV